MLRRGCAFTSLRLRLVVVFGLVALTAAVSASGIAYWLNREAVLTRTQDAALERLPPGDAEPRGRAARRTPRRTNCSTPPGRWPAAASATACCWSARTPTARRCTAARADLDGFTLQDVPESLRTAVNKKQPVDSGNKYAYHLYWQRDQSTTARRIWWPATKVIGGGPTGYMLKSLEPEAQGPQLAGLVAGDRHRAGAGRLGAARAGRRDDRAASPCSGSATPPAGSARASWTPGCGCPAPTNSPICHGRSTSAAERAGEAGRRHERAGRGVAGGSSPTCRTSCAPR